MLELWSIIYKQTNMRPTRAEEDVQETVPVLGL